MLMQTGQLNAVKPHTDISGFSVEIKRHNSPIVADSCNEDLVIDCYFEVTVISDGTNKKYPETGRFTVLISQLITNCKDEFVSNCPILMLKPFEWLTAINVQYGTFEQRYGVWLAFLVKNRKTGEETVHGYIFRPD